MWGPYLVHKRILMIDKQIQHAVDYSSTASIKVVAHSAYHRQRVRNLSVSGTFLQEFMCVLETTLVKLHACQN